MYIDSRLRLLKDDVSISRHDTYDGVCLLAWFFGRLTVSECSSESCIRERYTHGFRRPAQAARGTAPRRC